MQWCNSISCLGPHNYQLLYLVIHYFFSLSGYHFSHHASELNYVHKILTCRFNRKIISLLGKKNTGKKTPKEDSELGYLDFTLELTFN